MSQFELDTKAFDRILDEIEKVNGRVDRVIESVLSDAAKKIQSDTLEAAQKPNYPAGGRYSGGQTRESIATQTTVDWEGMVATIPVGFDFSKLGAGGFLISGTPMMAPVPQLRRIYRQKAYMAGISKGMQEHAWAILKKLWG
jgi:hypothetical protein